MDIRTLMSTYRRQLVWAWIALAIVAGAKRAEAAPGPVFDIPRLDHVQIDGHAEDWGTSGFRIDVLPDKDGKLKPKADFEPHVRLAWNAKGLLVLVNVNDNVVVESANPAGLSEQDSVELFVGTSPAADTYYQVVVSPGVTAGFPQERHVFRDFRNCGGTPGLATEIAAARTDSGYILEALMPWSNLGVTPHAGASVGFQVSVNDADGPTGRFQGMWHPAPRVNDDNRFYALRLGRSASPAYTVQARGAYDGKGRAEILLKGADQYIGQTITLRDGRKELTSGAFEAAGDWASARLAIPMPAPGANYGPLTLRVGGKSVGSTVFLGDVDVVRAQMLLQAELVASTYVFNGAEFPRFDFSEPITMQTLFGPYRVTTTYYDRDYEVVTAADAPGRYGAVIDVTFERGPKLRRFQTVCRAPLAHAGFNWLYFRPEFAPPFPATLEITPDAAARESAAIGKFYKDLTSKAFRTDERSAALVAGLQEAAASGAKATVSDDFIAADRQWWVGLKRKLYGTDASFSRTFTAPRPLEGPPAPTLRDGTPEQAGITADTVRNLDSLCAEWAEKSGEPFATCLVRHGVMFYHKAFGKRDGQPVTTDTRSWMASISKLLSGTLMMTLVDQGLVDLDAPIDTYLPRFRGITVRKPLVVRDCYIHTNGLQLGISGGNHVADHWGDTMHDLEEQIAEYYPYLQVRTKHAYNGVGYALGGKIMESVTGEALPQLARRHLLGPLGCDNTEITDGSAWTFSTPRDIATIGQMLLNKGAYGDKRFFTEATFQKMMPIDLAPILNKKTEIKWGIGAVYMGGNGLSANTFGHGAASSATFMMDPENDLVIVMTRNSGGPKFGEYHTRFIKAITDGLVK